MRELMFNTDAFYEEAMRRREPEESLDELLERYHKETGRYNTFTQRLSELPEPEPDSEEELRIGMAEFNASEFIEILEERIDTKICYMNRREAESGKLI